MHFPSRENIAWDRVEQSHCSLYPLILDMSTNLLDYVRSKTSNAVQRNSSRNPCDATFDITFRWSGLIIFDA